MHRHIAFGMNGKVELWARVKDVDPDTGEITFYVINGLWRGKFLNGQISVDGEPLGSAEVMWRGEADFQDSEYNEAICWIESQVAGYRKYAEIPIEDWMKAHGYDPSQIEGEPWYG